MMVSHRSLSDCKSPRVSRSSILTDLNNAVVWMVSNCHLIFNSSSPCINPLVTVQSTPITICITVTFMFYSFCCSVAKFKYSFSLLFIFTLWSARKAKSNIRQVLFFYYQKVWLLVSQKFQIILCLSFSRKDSGLCIKNLFVWWSAF